MFNLYIYHSKESSLLDDINVKAMELGGLGALNFARERLMQNADEARFCSYRYTNYHNFHLYVLMIGM